MRTCAKQKSVAKATALGAGVPRAELFFLIRLVYWKKMDDGYLQNRKYYSKTGKYYSQGCAAEREKQGRQRMACRDMSKLTGLQQKKLWERNGKKFRKQVEGI